MKNASIQFFLANSPGNWPQLLADESLEELVREVRDVGRRRRRWGGVLKSEDDEPGIGVKRKFRRVSKRSARRW